jgi:ATP-dependent Zn protease
LEPGFTRSEETLRSIDTEIKAILTTEHARARAELTQRRAALDAIARELLGRETLQRGAGSDRERSTDP